MSTSTTTGLGAQAASGTPTTTGGPAAAIDSTTVGAPAAPRDAATVSDAATVTGAAVVSDPAATWPTGGGARVAIAYHSGYGHTARQAEAVAAGAASVPGTATDLVPLDELTDEVWARLIAADAIIFGAPTYMGSPSWVFKKFAEESVRIWAADLGWRDKIAAGFTNSKAMSGDKLNSLVDFTVFAAQHGMIWVGLDLYPGWADSTASIEDLNRLGSWLGAMAQSDADLSAEKAPPETDLRTAAALGARVAKVTQRHLRGALAA